MIASTTEALTRDYAFTHITVYGTHKPWTDVLILNLHDCDVRQFLHTYPEVLEATIASNADFLFYLALENDTFASALSHATALATERLDPTLKTVVLDVRIPRGIADINRLPAHAVRNIFSDDRMPSMAKLLLPVVHATQRTIWNCLRQVHRHGVTLDCHTMAPFTPRLVLEGGQMKETPDGLAAYNDSYCDNKGGPRSIDLITDSEAGVVACQNLTRSVDEALSSLHMMDIHYNAPYLASSQTLCQQIMNATRALTIDFPKDLFSVSDRHECSFLPALLIEDRDRISAVGNALGRAAVHSLNRDTSRQISIAAL